MLSGYLNLPFARPGIGWIKFWVVFSLLLFERLKIISKKEETWEKNCSGTACNFSSNSGYVCSFTLWQSSLQHPLQFPEPGQLACLVILQWVRWKTLKSSSNKKSFPQLCYID